MQVTTCSVLNDPTFQLHRECPCDQPPCLDLFDHVHPGSTSLWRLLGKHHICICHSLPPATHVLAAAGCNAWSSRTVDCTRARRLPGWTLQGMSCQRAAATCWLVRNYVSSLHTCACTQPPGAPVPLQPCWLRRPCQLRWSCFFQRGRVGLPFRITPRSEPSSEPSSRRC
jgi:hypothetical protein